MHAGASSTRLSWWATGGTEIRYNLRDGIWEHVIECTVMSKSKGERQGQRLTSICASISRRSATVVDIRTFSESVTYLTDLVDKKEETCGS